MEDLKQIQEFFSKPLNENVHVKAFELGKALKGMGYDVKVKAVDDFGKNVFEIYFNNPADADDSIYYDVEKLGYDNVRVFANPQESIDEASKEEETEFHTKLDKLVHDTFGKRKGEMEEYNTGLYYDPAKEKNASKSKEASKSALEKVKDMIQKIIKEEEGYSQYLKDDPEHPDGKTKGLDTRTMNKILMKVIQDLDEKKKPGLWANIHAKRERGEEPSHGNSKAHKSAVKAGKKINKEKSIAEDQQDNTPEEKAFDADLMDTANGIASILGKELKVVKEEKEQLDEVAALTAISVILTGNALISFISKMAAKLFKKLDWKKGEDIAEKIHHWAHDNELAFQAPIKRVLGFFIKDEKTLELTTKAIYAIVIASMAANYGAAAVGKLAKADWFKGAFSALKTVAKADEAYVNAYPVLKALGV